MRNDISVMRDPEGVRHKQTVIRCKSRIPNTRLPKCHDLYVFVSFIYLRFTPQKKSLTTSQDMTIRYNEI